MRVVVVLVVGGSSLSEHRQTFYFLLYFGFINFLGVGSSTHDCLHDHIFIGGGICCSPTRLLFRVGYIV